MMALLNNDAWNLWKTSSLAKMFTTMADREERLIRAMLERWVSGLEPVIVRDHHTNQLLGLGQAGVPVGAHGGLIVRVEDVGGDPPWTIASGPANGDRFMVPVELPMSEYVIHKSRLTHHFTTPVFEARGLIPAPSSACRAEQCSDQMYCRRCDRTQDVNEPSPRPCPLTGRDMRVSGPDPHRGK